MKPRLILADDHALILDAFESLLATDFEVVAKVTDGHALLKAAARERPDAVVIDLMMPCMNGLDAARQLRKDQPGVRIVFVTMMDDPMIATEAVRLGGCGYVLKQSAGSDLLAALRQVMQNKTYVSPLISGQVLSELLDCSPAAEGRQALSLRQREVLQLLAEGRSMKEIGRILKIAPRTVAFHKYRMMEQLEIKSNAQLVQFAMKHHLVH